MKDGVPLVLVVACRVMMDGFGEGVGLAVLSVLSHGLRCVAGERSDDDCSGGENDA